MNLISRKKIIYKISPALKKYLKSYGREEKLPVSYADLTAHNAQIALYDRKGKDTLWESVFYPPGLMEELHTGLKKVYAILKAAGNVAIIKHLYIDRVDLCVYGNTLPYRIRIVNKLNDNFDYFYIKQADASRIYGLELEHLLSPNRIGYIVHNNTLVEEHIVGIPADQFLKLHLADDSNIRETRLAKEFVKFNERCLIRLLGDMHSSNFVIEVTPDFEETHYRMRAIDFDQQSFEMKKSVYMPQFFKQNKEFVDLAVKHLTPESVTQYQLEERSLIANRIRSSKYQIKDLLDTMLHEEIAPMENIKALREQLAEHYTAPEFLKCKTMGELVKTSLKMLVKKG